MIKDNVALEACISLVPVCCLFWLLWIIWSSDVLLDVPVHAFKLLKEILV